MTTTDHDSGGMSEDDRAKFAETATRYLPLIPAVLSGRDRDALSAAHPRGAEPPSEELPSSETIWQIVLWQRIETEVLEAHAAWLTKVKRAIESRGLPYNRDNFLRHTRLWEIE